MKIVRILGAVMLGYVLFLALTLALFFLTGHKGHEPASMGWMVVLSVLGIAIGFLSGFVSARVGRGSASAFLLGVLVAILSAWTLISRWGQVGNWATWVTLFLITPAICAGGVFERNN